MHNVHSYESVIEFFDGVPKLAEKLSVTKQAVYQWKDGFPPEQAIEIERLSKGRLKAVNMNVRKSRPSAAA